MSAAIEVLQDAVGETNERIEDIKRTIAGHEATLLATHEAIEAQRADMADLQEQHKELVVAIIKLGVAS